MGRINSFIMFLWCDIIKRLEARNELRLLYFDYFTALVDIYLVQEFY